MTCPATSMTGFNKSKEDFIWFIKKASTDKKSDARGELYHCLLKMFVDADTNRDGLVSKESFSKLIDVAASIPREYGYAPVDTELYKTEQAKEKARQLMFESMDLKGTGVITFDEWLKFCLEHIIAKTSTMDPHPILDHGNMEQFKEFLKTAVQPGTAEHTEMFWFLLELFTDHDTDKDGIVMMVDFPTMMDKVLETPKKLDIAHPDQAALFEKDAEKRRECQLGIFKKNNPRGDDRMCVDEWVGLTMDIFKKMV